MDLAQSVWKGLFQSYAGPMRREYEQRAAGGAIIAAGSVLTVIRR